MLKRKAIRAWTILNSLLRRNLFNLLTSKSLSSVFGPPRTIPLPFFMLFWSRDLQQEMILHSFGMIILILPIIMHPLSFLSYPAPFKLLKPNGFLVIKIFFPYLFTFPSPAPIVTFGIQQTPHALVPLDRCIFLRHNCGTGIFCPY